jgi:hypothetical protein
VDRVEDAVSGELGCEVVGEVLVREEKKKKKSRKSMVVSEFERCFSVRVDSVGSNSIGDLVVAAASFLQAGTVVAASAHECDVFVEKCGCRK